LNKPHYGCSYGLANNKFFWENFVFFFWMAYKEIIVIPSAEKKNRIILCRLKTTTSTWNYTVYIIISQIYFRWFSWYLGRKKLFSSFFIWLSLFYTTHALIDTPLIDTPLIDTSLIDTSLIDTSLIDTPLIDTFCDFLSNFQKKKKYG